VSQPLPIVTVIIAAPPDLAEVQAVAAARKLDYPADRLEIIVARGRQPSVQRNVALRAARGEWIYFLDDDALAPPDNLRRAETFLHNPAVAMVGGPNICPPGAPLLEQVFAVVLASWLAFGPSRARYTPVGEVRDTGEKELILCNTLARAAALLELGGFNEALYPNEENALMDELQKRGRRLVYDPQFIVHRRPRRTLKSFLKMLRTYGRGRAEQFRLHPTPGSALNFVPPLFCLYLVALAVANCLSISNSLRLIIALPLLIYFVATVLQTLVSMKNAGVVRAVLALPLLVASHVFYGLGFWRGLFTKLNPGGNRAVTEVVLETIARQ
jgi:cellulose synthase/poly-beta-1,6-N-acetylglucosamine synthase-like glycosyltransferase